MDASDCDVSQFRSMVCDFIDVHYPKDRSPGLAETWNSLWGGRRQVAETGPARDWLNAMASAGWVAPMWPTEYGGAALSRAEARVLSEELQKRGARAPLQSPNLGILMLGPVLLAVGTEQQKRRFLPPIARGEIRWCQGFSEPQAGSDLASLRTRAVRQNDCYRVNGHKIWSSFAHEADWMFCLVRTDSEVEKHRGLSLLLIDLASSGLQVSPIRLISDESLFNEVFLTDVVVPAEQRLGAEGDGWALAMSILQHERSAVFASDSSNRSSRKRLLTELMTQRISEDHSDGWGAGLREDVAAHGALVRAVKATQRRYRDEGRRDLASASLIKLITSESHKQRYDLLVEVGGLDALVWDGNGADGFNSTARSWLRSRGNSIEGGTSEMQINIIAKRALGLVESD
jgi:acyl-CoA dehydrogenase